MLSRNNRLSRSTTIRIVDHMNTPLNTQHLDAMSWTVSKSGFDSIPTAALRELGFEARRAGVSASVAHTLVDSDVPLVVRQRAFGHIASKIGNLWHHDDRGDSATPAVRAA
jgi:hypothetical protein